MESSPKEHDFGLLGPLDELGMNRKKRPIKNRTEPRHSDLNVESIPAHLVQSDQQDPDRLWE